MKAGQKWEQKHVEKRAWCFSLLILAFFITSQPAKAQTLANTTLSQKFSVTASTVNANVYSTGTIRAAGFYNVFRAEVKSDVAGTLAIQTSTSSNKSNFSDFATVGVSSGVPTSLEIDITAPYVRSIFRNGGTNQTLFYHVEKLQLIP